METTSSKRQTITAPNTTRAAVIIPQGDSFMVTFGFTDADEFGGLRCAHGKNSRHYTTKAGALRGANRWAKEAK